MVAGAYMQTGEVFDLPGNNLAGNTSGFSSGTYGLYDSVRVSSGSFADELPISLDVRTVSGANVCSFFDDFYNVIYLIPSVLDFGAIGNDTTLTVRVFNAFLAPMDLQAINELNTEGMTAVGPAPPYTLNPLGLATYLFTATTVGPSTINAQYTFDFGVASATLFASGSRATMVPFSPNWSTPLTKVLSYKTDILTTKSGREQRRALRSHPRISLDFDIIRSGQNSREFNNLLMTQQDNRMLVPDFTRTIRTTAVMPALTSIVTVENVPHWLIVGSSLVFQWEGIRETRTVATIDGLEITFTGVGDVDIPEFALVRPTLVTRIQEDQSVNWETNTVTTIGAVFDAIPGEQVREEPLLASEYMNGLEIFGKQPNWAAGIEDSMKSARNMVDFDRGATSLYTSADHPTRTTKMAFNGLDALASEELTSFFMRQKGRRGQFWVPSWESDILPKSDLGNGGNSVIVEGEEFLSQYKDSIIHRALVVNLHDGTKLYREVDLVYSVTDGSTTDTAIQVTEVWPTDILVADIRDISWVYLSRFAQDSLTTQWLTGTVSQMQMSFVSLAKDSNFGL